MNNVNGSQNAVFVPDQQTAKSLNKLARHQMIHKLMADIRLDLAVCEIEGWDKREYIDMLYKELRGLEDACDQSRNALPRTD